MANFFLDNQDIQFLFNTIDLQEIARLQELQTEDAGADYAPLDAADAVDNYRRTLEIVGSVAGDTIAPNAETVDREGNTLNENGTVTWARLEKGCRPLELPRNSARRSKHSPTSTQAIYAVRSSKRNWKRS